MRKFIFIITFISLLISGCNSSTNSTQYGKYSLEQIEKMGYNKSLKIGIKFYKNKNNKFALPFLERAASFESYVKNTKGPASYYLGNVLMNLNKYKKAIKFYSIAFFAKYKEKNSVFNMACAHSLLGEYQLALYCLIDNYQDGDRNFKRIKKDADLIKFRKSKYYKLFFQLIEYPDVGFSPKTKADFMKSIIFGKNAPEPDTMTPGYTRIEKNGFFIDSGGPQNYWPDVGTWKIDEENQIFIIKVYGKSPIGNHEKIMSVKEISKYKPFKKVKIYKIPFKDIKLNIKGFHGAFYLESYNKFVKGIIGTSRKNGTRIIFGKLGSSL